MHPNTEHLVVSLKDSLACGAHFYCIDHMVKTLHALIAEHFCELITNAEHPKTVLMVVQWTLAIRDRFVDEQVPRRSLNGAADIRWLEAPGKSLTPPLCHVPDRVISYAVFDPERIRRNAHP